MHDRALRPAFYAAAPGAWYREWWTLLHPPYTAWHLSYVAIGAALAPRLDLGRLGLVTLAFLLGLGVGAHALDELNGRPLRTSIPDPVLWGAAATSLAAAAALGVAGVAEVGPLLLAFIAFAVLAVLAYNLEWLGGRFHGDTAFALAWGAFPVLTGYFVQTGTLHVPALWAAAAAAALSYAQRVLSSRARALRRRTLSVTTRIVTLDGRSHDLDLAELLRPTEVALKAMAAAVLALAIALVTRHVWP